MFGFPLATQPKDATTGLPFILVRCIEEVEKRGMDDEGIYRKAGIKSAVEGVCALFEERGDSNNPVDLSVEPDINAVTGCLKGFFRNVCFSAAVAFFLVFFFFLLFFFVFFFFFFFFRFLNSPSPAS